MHPFTLLLLASCAVFADASRHADILTSATGTHHAFSGPDMSLGIANTRHGLDMLGCRTGEATGRLRATPEASRFQLAMADAAHDMSRAGSGKLRTFTGERDLTLREKGSKVDVEASHANSRLAGLAASRGGAMSASSGKLNTFSGEHKLHVRLSGSDVRGEASNTAFGAARSADMEYPAHAMRSSIKKIHTFTGDKDMTLSDNGSRVAAEFTRHRLRTRKAKAQHHPEDISERHIQLSNPILGRYSTIPVRAAREHILRRQEETAEAEPVGAYCEQCSKKVLPDRAILEPRQEGGRRQPMDAAELCALCARVAVRESLSAQKQLSGKDMGQIPSDLDLRKLKQSVRGSVL